MSWDWYCMKNPPPKCECGKSETPLEVKCCWTLVCPACGACWPDRKEDEGENYTSNTSMMLQVASVATGCVPTEVWVGEFLEGKLCSEVADILRKSTQWMADHPTEMKAMNPDNGWGNFDSYLQWLRRWQDACEKYPNHICHISR